MSDPITRVAVFDLDGTLTWRDTLVGFLLGYVRRHPARVVRLWRVPCALGGYVLSGFDRGLLKQQVIQIFMRGDDRGRIDAWGRMFAEQTLRRGCRPAALDALRKHQQAGDFVVLLSASPDLYVPKIGMLLGVDRIICTEVEYHEDRLTGTLTTANRRGEEKLRCLQRLRSEFPAATFSAYGNSGSDLMHLRDADHPLLVNANAGARRQARRLNIATANWT